MNKKRAKHNRNLVQMTCFADILEKGGQACERDSALAAQDSACLKPLVALAISKTKDR